MGHSSILSFLILFIVFILFSIIIIKNLMNCPEVNTISNNNSSNNDNNLRPLFCNECNLLLPCEPKPSQLQQQQQKSLFASDCTKSIRIVHRTGKWMSVNKKEEKKNPILYVACKIADQTSNGIDHSTNPLTDLFVVVELKYKWKYELVSS